MSIITSGSGHMPERERGPSPASGAGSGSVAGAGAAGPRRLDPLPDNDLALNLVRTTEAAALGAARWVGRGDKNAADQGAVDAMRLFFNAVPMRGVVVIGEGEKDEAPMLYNGEAIGTGSPPEVDVAVDPIDGTRLVAQGQANALSVVAVAARGAMFNPGPCVYMEKIVTGRDAADAIDIAAPIEDNIRNVARAKGLAVRDVTVMILDRPRHEEIVGRVRAIGARVYLLPDGDVAGAITAARLGTGVDLLYGIGGTPEGVVAAAALKCLGGAIQGRLHARDERERRPRSTPATTSTASSRPTTWSRETRPSSPARASPTGRWSRASASPRRRHHRVDRHARQLGHRPRRPRRAPDRQDPADLRRFHLSRPPSAGRSDAWPGPVRPR